MCFPNADWYYTKLQNIAEFCNLFQPLCKPQEIPINQLGLFLHHYDHSFLSDLQNRFDTMEIIIFRLFLLAMTNLLRPLGGSILQ